MNKRKKRIFDVKRLLSLFLVISLLLVVFPTAAFADTTVVNFSVQDKTVTGNQVTVPIYIDQLPSPLENKGIMSFIIKLNYDPTVLNIVSTSPGTAVTEGTGSIGDTYSLEPDLFNQDSGVTRIVLGCVTNGVTSTGVIYNVVFNVLSTPSNNKTGLSLTVDTNGDPAGNTSQYTGTFTNAVLTFPSNDATVSSSIFTVDNVASTVNNVPYGTTLSTFKAGITPATGASFEVYQANGTTVATDLKTDYKVKVTAEDRSTTKTYTVTVSPNTDATLSSSIGTVSNSVYTITNVPYGTTLSAFKAGITPAADASFEVYQADGTTVATDLKTDYRVIVTAQDTITTKTYTVVVNQNNVATLSNLTVTAGTLTPVFSPSTLNYTDTLPNGTNLNTPPTVTPTATDSNATVTTSPSAIKIAPYTHTPSFTDPADAQYLTTITVTAEDNSTTQTYKVAFVEDAPATVEVVSITNTTDTITTGTLQLTYSVTPSNAPQTVTWSITAGSDYATIDPTSGLLTVKGNGTVTVRATSTSDTSKYGEKTFTITEQQAAGLYILSVSPVALNETFSNTTLAYTVTADYTSPSISVYSHAIAGTTKVNDIVATGPVTIDLGYGANTITIVVSEPNKTNKTYTITVNKAYPFTISTPTLTPSGSVIGATANVSGSYGSTNAVVVFELFQNDTPLGIVAVEKVINSSTGEAISALFPSYTGTGYTVQVMVFDSLTNSATQTGNILAQLKSVSN